MRLLPNARVKALLVEVATVAVAEAAMVAVVVAAVATEVVATEAVATTAVAVVATAAVVVAAAMEVATSRPVDTEAVVTNCPSCCPRLLEPWNVVLSCMVRRTCCDTQINSLFAESIQPLGILTAICLSWSPFVVDVFSVVV